MKTEYSVVEAHYESTTAYRVVKQETDDETLTTVHVYADRVSAEDIAEILNNTLGAC